MSLRQLEKTVKIILFVLAFMATVRIAFAQDEELPVSANYLSVQGCFADFNDDKLKSSFELKGLKAWLDKKFVTVRSHLLERVVEYRESNGTLARIKIQSKGYNRKGKAEQTLTLEHMNQRGEWGPREISKKDRINPTPEVIRTYIGNKDIQSDIQKLEEVKDNSARMLVLKDRDKVTELEIRIKAKKHRLSCRTQADGMIFCLCLKN